MIIADEPTTALDVTVQLQVLGILDEMVSRRGMGLMFISHDLHLVASFCDRVLVMYMGQAMEVSEVARLRLEAAFCTATSREHSSVYYVEYSSLHGIAIRSPNSVGGRRAGFL